MQLLTGYLKNYSSLYFLYIYFYVCSYSVASYILGTVYQIFLKQVAMHWPWQLYIRLYIVYSQLFTVDVHYVYCAFFRSNMQICSICLPHQAYVTSVRKAYHHTVKQLLNSSYHIAIANNVCWLVLEYAPIPLVCRLHIASYVSYDSFVTVMLQYFYWLFQTVASYCSYDMYTCMYTIILMWIVYNKCKLTAFI